NNDVVNDGKLPVTILNHKAASNGRLPCPRWAYRHRHLVENLWARLKEWRAVATRYEKTAASFLSVILIAATADYIKT
ncbi:transposase, partial [Gluconacetobacter entanii]